MEETKPENTRAVCNKVKFALVSDPVPGYSRGRDGNVRPHPDVHRLSRWLFPRRPQTGNNRAVHQGGSQGTEWRAVWRKPDDKMCTLWGSIYGTSWEGQGRRGQKAGQCPLGAGGAERMLTRGAGVGALASVHLPKNSQSCALKRENPSA